MAGDVLRLYPQGGEPDAAYFLESGKVFFFLTDQDRYAVSGQNLIVGSTELIMNHYLGKEAKRIETSVTPPDSKIKKISLEKFVSGMENLSFAINTAMVLAKQVKETNRIIRSEIGNLEGKAQKQKEDAMEFYTIVARLAEEFDKRKLPWLNDLVGDRKQSLMYKKGEAFKRSEEPVTVEPPASLNDSDMEYVRGNVLCEEGDDGNDMFILKSGSIDVLVSGNKVAAIDTPGTVIGEMALLLGEKRSATLRAGNRVVVNRVARSDLKKIAESDMGVIQSISFALAKRHFFNVFRISTINKSLAEKTISEADEGSKAPSGLDSGHLELRNLKTEVEEAADSKNGDFLSDLIDNF